MRATPRELAIANEPALLATVAPSVRRMRGSAPSAARSSSSAISILRSGENSRARGSNDCRSSEASSPASSGAGTPFASSGVV